MGHEPSSEHARRQLTSRVDALEYHRSAGVAARLQLAEELDAEAVSIGASDLAMRARLVRADMLQRSGHPIDAAVLVQEVTTAAQELGSRPLLARCHMVMSSLFETIGDAPAGLEHALMAVELADDETPPRFRGNLVMRLADALAFDGSSDAARERYREAQQVFSSIGDVERQLNVLNNLAFTEIEAGDAAEARRRAEEMLQLATTSGLGLNAEFAHTLAEAQLAAGEHESSAATLEQALGDLGSSGDIQAATPAELLLSLAIARRHLGLLVEAQEALDRCLAVCEERDLGAIEADATAEQAELHAAAGRFDLAFAKHKEYHARTVARASARREASARTRQVLFEAAEARRDADRYWRQARTDQLTGLPNRRYLDEELPRRLAGSDREPVVVAIIDADHFKRVNDSLSHDIGDQAIRRLAEILETTLADDRRRGLGPEGFVARLGGEEFLAVLSDPIPATCAAELERLRAAVEGYDWAAVIGELRLTVSIGATSCLSGDTQGDILRRADGHLYGAKRAGRNRVAFDPS